MFAQTKTHIADVPNKGSGIKFHFTRIKVHFENLKNGLRFGDFDSGVWFQSRFAWNGPKRSLHFLVFSISKIPKMIEENAKRTKIKILILIFGQFVFKR